LEDSVPVGAKEDARATLRQIPPSEVPILVRVNGPETKWIWEDLAYAVPIRPVAIVVPKAETTEALNEVAGALSVLEATSHVPSGSIALVPIIETVAGVLAVRKLARGKRVEALFFGSGERGDLVADLGAEWSPDGAALLHGRAECILAARGAGHETVIDGVFMDIRNLQGLKEEALLARRLGYTAKALIHPGQIGIAHEVFTPSPDDVEEQRRILELYAKALEGGRGSIDIDGKMIDYAVAKVAERVIRRAEVAATADARSRRAPGG
jgi:citrate lyase subunit beta/citryl-CoA lyase